MKAFDVSDTEGSPFAAPSSLPIRADQELVSERLRQLEEWVRHSGLDLRLETPVVNRLVDGATNGLRIWVRPDLGPPERLVVLAHEIAHVKLHFPSRQRGQALITDTAHQRPSRNVAELQAELTAFLLLELAGIDSAQGTATYLNSWNASMSKIRKHAAHCFLTACSVLRACETRRYRPLVKTRTVSLLEQTRTVLQPIPPASLHRMAARGV